MFNLCLSTAPSTPARQCILIQQCLFPWNFGFDKAWELSYLFVPYHNVLLSTMLFIPVIFVPSVVWISVVTLPHDLIIFSILC
jgi:hypothetical protein